MVAERTGRCTGLDLCSVRAAAIQILKLTDPPHSSLLKTRLLVIGAGFSGIALGLRLLARGERDFIILDQAEGVGGTWWVNRYPGCACDVQSHLYSLSFAGKPNWSRQFAPRAEIQAYLEQLVHQSGLNAHLKLSRRVECSHWNEQEKCWQIRDHSGQHYQAEVLVSAIGGLSRPNWPTISGLETFQGPVIHSQQWPDQLRLTGKRVAVIGSGASAIQFVPQIQPQVSRLDLYQRTAQWILPKPDRPIAGWKKRLYRFRPARRLVRFSLFMLLESRLPAFNRLPALSALHRRKARRFLQREISDPALRSRLSPDYAMGCKRVLMSNDFYPAINSANVELVSQPIEQINSTGIIDQQGRHRAIDLIILATGFRATSPLPEGLIIGREGRDLAEVWTGGPAAYKGISVPGFPNFFMLLGPNTALGHNSVLLMIEAQIRYLLSALDWMADRSRSVEVQAQAMDDWNRQLDRKLQRSVWSRGGCASWYLHPVSGRNTTLWPDYVHRYARQTRRFDPEAYHTVGRADSAADAT